LAILVRPETLARSVIRALRETLASLEILGLTEIPEQKVTPESQGPMGTQESKAIRV
jgi:hypothetical protein